MKTKGTTNIPSSYVILRRGDEALFVLREHTGFMDGSYSLPAGHVEYAESFSHGAARETLEEVGVLVNPADLRHAFTMHRYQSDDAIKVDVFFEAEDWQGEPHNAEPHKHSKIAWLSLRDLPKTIMDYQRYALEQIMAGKTYAERDWK